jgi:hypothetical protein
VASIFREDELVLEAQQQAIDAHPDHQLLQPEHRRRLDVGAPADRWHGGQPSSQRGGAPVIPIRQVA